MCLRIMCGITRMDRVRNEVVRERLGVPDKLSKRVDRKVLKQFGHVERRGIRECLNENRKIKWILHQEKCSKTILFIQLHVNTQKRKLVCYTLLTINLTLMLSAAQEQSINTYKYYISQEKSLKQRNCCHITLYCTQNIQ